MAMILCLINLTGIAFGTTASTVTLNDISVDLDDSFSAVTLRLSAKPAWKTITPTMHGTFAQFDLPQTFVTNPGAFIEGENKFIAKVVAFQTNETDAALRVFLTADAPKDASRWKSDVLDQRLVITLDHPATDPVAAVSTAQPASEVDSGPAALLKNNQTSGTSFAAFDDKLKGSLRKVSVFAGIGLLFVLGLYAMRPGLRRRRKKNMQKEEELIKTLATQTLAHKQTISLVEVADEKLLLSITPAGVQFLTTIGKNQIHVPTQVTVPMVGQQTFLPRIEQKPASANDIEMSSAKPLTAADQSDLKSVLKSTRKEKPLRRSPKHQQKTDTHSNTNNSATVNDVTQMIRERLKGLQQIG